MEPQIMPLTDADIAALEQKAKPKAQPQPKPLTDADIARLEGGDGMVKSAAKAAWRGVEAVGKFINEKVDQPARRLVGAPATGEEFAKRVGISDAPVVPASEPGPGLLPANSAEAMATLLGYRKVAPTDLGEAAVSVMREVPRSKAAGLAYEVAASPLNLLPLAPKALGAIGARATAKAEKLAEAATGATRLQAEKFRPGTGRVLLDEGVVSFGKSPAGVAKAAKDRLKETGEAIGQVVQDLELRGAPATSRDEIAARMFKRARRLKAENDELKRQTGEALEEIAERFSNAEKKSLPLTAVEQEKRAFAGLGRYDKRNPIPAPKQDAYKEASEVLRAHTEDVAIRMDSGLADLFTREKELYGVLKPVEKAATARAKQLQQHPIGGFLDTVTAVGSGSLGLLGGGSELEKAGAAVLTGLGGALGRRLVAPRVASSMAATLNRVGQALGPRYMPAIEKAAKTGFPVSQMTKLAETPEGVNTLKLILKDVAAREESGPIERLKRRDQRNSK